MRKMLALLTGHVFGEGEQEGLRDVEQESLGGGTHALGGKSWGQGFYVTQFQSLSWKDKSVILHPSSFPSPLS